MPTRLTPTTSATPSSPPLRYVQKPAPYVPAPGPFRLLWSGLLSGLFFGLVRQLTLSRGPEKRKALLKHVTISVHPGDVCFVMGPSGAGTDMGPSTMNSPHPKVKLSLSCIPPPPSLLF